MQNYELGADEVILYEGMVRNTQVKDPVQTTLTSKRIIFEQEVGFFKKEKKLIDIISLESIKVYNNEVQITQNNEEVTIQSTEKNIKLIFEYKSDASKFTNKIIDTLTGTTLGERRTDKIKDAINTIDDVLGIDTRNTIKGVMENGIAGTLLKGFKKKHK